MLVLILSGCQKDETPAASNSNQYEFPAETIERGNVPASPSIGLVLITIDHLAIKSMLPDYSVTLYTDGTLIFNGRKNVEYIGLARLHTSKESLITIKNMIAGSAFFTMRETKSLAQDLSKIITSCKGLFSDKKLLSCLGKEGVF